MRFANTIIILCIIIVFSGCKDIQNIEVSDSNDKEEVIIQEDDINTDVQESIETQGHDDKESPVGKSILIGLWHDAPYIGSLDGSMYHFYEDGSYIFEYSEYDKEKRVLSEMGVWGFENDILTLTINSKITIEGGEESTEPLLLGDTNEFVIVNGKIKIVELNPSEMEEHDLTDMFIDTDEGNGFWAIDIKGIRFWQLHDFPDVYLNGPYNDGDIYRPWG